MMWRQQRIKLTDFKEVQHLQLKCKLKCALHKLCPIKIQMGRLHLGFDGARW